MAKHGRLKSAARRRVIDVLTKLLTKPLRSYEQRIPNNLKNLKEHLRVGDVVLVEGDQRISQVIRYLTQSSWSHSALYIGDELRRFKPGLADALVGEHGDEARHMVIEAVEGEGVVCSPIAKYVRHNLRVCRPRSLRREDLDRVLLQASACSYTPCTADSITALPESASPPCSTGWHCPQRPRARSVPSRAAWSAG